VHLCIVYGSIWNRGLAQAYGPTLGPGGTVFYVILLLATMAGLALYWNWWKHTRPRLARWTALAVGGLLVYRLL
jgi:phosphoglycerol transferase MdoB-like AlkP superfamily enzyme